MSETFSLHGYNTGQQPVLNKDGQEMTPDTRTRYQCILCHYFLRQPCQLVICGDRVCKDCLPSSPFDCPACGEHIDITKSQQFFNDKSCQNDIKGFRVVCKCGKKISLDEWLAHWETCPSMEGERPPRATVAQPPPELRQIQGEMRWLKTELEDVKRSASKALRKTEGMEQQLQQLRSMIEDVRSTARVSEDGGRIIGGAKPGASGDVDLKPQVKRLNEKYGQLNDIVTQLVSDVEQHKGTIAHMNTSVEQFSQVIPRYESYLEELNLKIEILEVKTTTGIYVWKVNELARRFREARIGKTVSLYSPPFYTSPHGYRMCLRAYLYGDGAGKGTHVSLFMVLMRAEYDDLLSWPFRHRVTLTLISQASPLSSEAAITHKFIPDPESSSFRKPRDTFNVASGFPEFAPISVLQDASYVKEDTIYFRVKLDPPDLPSGPDTLVL